MTDSDNQFISRDHLLAKLALLAHAGKHKPKGDKPSDEELAMLIDDQLDFKRKEEVISHINADQALLEQWLQLVDIIAIEEKSSEKSDEKVSWLSWMTQWQALAGSIAVAGIASVLIFNSSFNEISPGIETQPEVATTQSKGQPKAKQFISPDKRAIAAGVKNSLSQSKVKLSYHINLNNAVDQQGTSLTPELYKTYFNLGQTIIKIAIQCQVKQPINSDLLNKLTELNTQLKHDSFIPMTQSLSGITSKTTSKDTCIKINQYLTSEL